MTFDELVSTDNLAIDMNHRAMLVLLGYRRGRTNLDQTSSALIKECLDEAKSLVHPRGVFVIRRIEARAPSQVRLRSSSLVLPGRSMERLLADATAVAIMAVTIGPDLERAVARQQDENEPHRAVVLDAIGSETVEAAAESLNALIETMARQAKASITRRFSPGYGDLPVEIQPAIHAELHLDGLGIQVTDRHMLLSQKSITAVIGVEES